jgi:hypothetical protein
LLDVGTDRNHHAGGREAERRRQRQGVDAGAVIDVDVVDGDRRMTDAHLTGSGLGHFDCLPGQHVRAA